MLSNMLITTNFDSAPLSGLASITHPLREPGHWRLEAHGPRRVPIRTVDIVLRDGGQARVAVDLGHPTQDTDCCTAIEQLLTPGGMINLHDASARGGGFALLFRGSERDPFWDSRVLEPGDHFACMPLRPGRYLLTNLLSNARSSLRVNYPDPRNTAQGLRLASGPLHAKVGRAIAPDELRIDPGQALVFAIEAECHLAATLEEPDDGPPELVEWRALRSRQALEAAFTRRHAS